MDREIRKKVILYTLCGHKKNRRKKDGCVFIINSSTATTISATAKTITTMTMVTSTTKSFFQIKFKNSSKLLPVKYRPKRSSDGVCGYYASYDGL